MSAENFYCNVKCFTLLQINNPVSHLQRQTPVNPLRHMHYLHAADVTESIAALSDISRTSRLALVSIQRFLPCFPPAISAGILQFMQQMQ